MADLSPEAQAVWTAFDDALETLDGYEAPLAAALRAAADGISYRWAAEEIVGVLDGIANELENHKP